MEVTITQTTNNFETEFIKDPIHLNEKMALLVQLWQHLQHGPLPISNNGPEADDRHQLIRKPMPIMKMVG